VKIRKQRKNRMFYFIRRLKMKMTEEELFMCKILRELGLPYKFQRWIRPTKYVTDFWLPIRTLIKKKKRGLIIEVDGGYHDERKEYDKKREKELIKRKRVDKILRFKNEVIRNQPDFVKKTIIDEVSKLRQDVSLS